jgi:hypothetical protein
VSLNQGFSSQALIFISGENLAVSEIAAEALYRITTSPEGAQATVDASVLECVAELLESPNEKVRNWTRDMLGELVRHEATVRVAMEQLVSLLQ